MLQFAYIILILSQNCIIATQLHVQGYSSALRHLLLKWFYEVAHIAGVDARMQELGKIELQDSSGGKFYDFARQYIDG